MAPERVADREARERMAVLLSNSKEEKTELYRNTKLHLSIDSLRKLEPLFKQSELPFQGLSTTVGIRIFEALYDIEDRDEEESTLRTVFRGWPQIYEDGLAERAPILGTQKHNKAQYFYRLNWRGLEISDILGPYEGWIIETPRRIGDWEAVFDR